MRPAVAGLLLGIAAIAPWRAHALELERPEVKAFVEDVAQRNHLKRRWVARIVGAAESRPSIIEAMNRPAEKVRPWFEYRRIFITERRIREGREFYAEHQERLDEVATRTGVPSEIIAAILGVETSYGRLTGPYRALDALATLAFDYPSRAPFFRAELEQFLVLSRDAGFDPLKVTSSYAGALGAPQFMPRSFRDFARDGDGDGHIDLWTNWADIFESVAHYFVAHGWHRDEPVVAVATLEDPDVADLPGNRLDPTETVASLRAKGVSFSTSLGDDAPALFIAQRDADEPAYRVGFHNFGVITRYNRSAKYALAVAELAEAIRGPTPPVTASPAPTDAAAAPGTPATPATVDGPGTPDPSMPPEAPAARGQGSTPDAVPVAPSVPGEAPK